MENCTRCPLQSINRECSPIISWGSILLIMFIVYVICSSFLEKNLENDISLNSRCLFSEISDIKTKYTDILSKLGEISLKLEGFEKQEVLP